MAGDLAGSDEDLWRSATTGDPEAFRVIFQRHADRVLTHCSRRLGTRHDGEDALSVVFLAAWAKPDKVRFVEGSLLPWLLVVSNNITSNLTRTRTREQRRLARAASESRGGLAMEDGVLDALTHAQRLRQVTAAIGRLRPDEQMLISLCDLGELTQADAAAVLRIPLGTVKSRLSRAHQKIRADVTSATPAATGISTGSLQRKADPR